MRKLRGALAALLVFGICAAAVQPAQATHHVEKRAMKAIYALEPDRAVGILTSAVVRCMHDPSPESLRRASTFLELTAFACNLDDNRPGALQCARFACILDPTNLKARSAEIGSLLDLGRGPAAKAKLDAMMQMAPDDPLTQYSNGNYLRFLGKNDEAVGAFRQAVQGDRKNMRAYMALANLFAGEDAAKEYENAAASTKSSYLRCIFLWQAENARRGKDANTKYLDMAAAVLPDDPAWRVHKAWYDIANGKQEEAFRLMQEAVSARRFSIRAFDQLAVYSMYHNKLDLAERCLKHLLVVCPERAETHWTMGVLRSFQKDHAAAEREYLKAIDMNPAFSAAYNSLSQLPVYNTDQSRKQWLVDRYTANCPYVKQPWLLAGQNCYAQKQYLQAAADFERAGNAIPNYGYAQQQRDYLIRQTRAWAGTASYKAGDRDAAQIWARQFEAVREIPDMILQVVPERIQFEKLAKGTVQEQSALHGAVANMLCYCAQYDDAITEYNAALKLNNDINWHRGLFQAYCDKRDLAHAFAEDTVISNHIVVEIPKALDEARKRFVH